MKTIQERTDVELILAYQASRSSSDFGELYKRYNQRVFLYCNKLLKNRDNAFDVTQDLFIKISDKLVNLKEPVTFTKWIFRIAHNDCIDFLRSSNKTRSVELNELHDSPEEDRKAEMELIASKYKFVNESLDRLPELEKRLFVKKYRENESIVMLADEFQLSISAVKMRLSRTRQKIASQYQWSVN